MPRKNLCKQSTGSQPNAAALGEVHIAYKQAVSYGTITSYLGTRETAKNMASMDPTPSQHIIACKEKQFKKALRRGEEDVKSLIWIV